MKSFLRSTTGNDRLSALAMLSIKKKMILEAKDFNSNVIDHFSVAKKRRMDFILKIKNYIMPFAVFLLQRQISICYQNYIKLSFFKSFEA